MDAEAGCIMSIESVNTVLLACRARCKPSRRRRLFMAALPAIESPEGSLAMLIIAIAETLPIEMSIPHASRTCTPSAGLSTKKSSEPRGSEKAKFTCPVLAATRGEAEADFEGVFDIEGVAESETVPDGEIVTEDVKERLEESESDGEIVGVFEQVGLMEAVGDGVGVVEAVGDGVSVVEAAGDCDAGDEGDAAMP